MHCLYERYDFAAEVKKEKLSYLVVGTRKFSSFCNYKHWVISPSLELLQELAER